MTSADRAVVNPLDRFHVLRFVSALQADRHHEVFLFCFFRNVQTPSDTRRVDGDWLFHENMFILGDRGIRNGVV